MSAGVLLVILKLLSLLGGFHTGGGTTPIFPLLVSLVAAGCWLKGFPGTGALSADTQLSRGVRTCSGASSSLLHNHVVDYFPPNSQPNSKVASVCVCQRDNLSTRGGLPRPSERQPDPGGQKVDGPCERAPHCWHIRTQSAFFFTLCLGGKKEQIMSAVIRLS